MPEKHIIDRINELARKKRQVGLTPEETREQTSLRAIYLLEFKNHMKQVLDNTVIQYPDGSREKLTRRQDKKGDGQAEG